MRFFRQLAGIPLHSCTPFTALHSTAFELSFIDPFYGVGTAIWMQRGALVAFRGELAFWKNWTMVQLKVWKLLSMVE